MNTARKNRWTAVVAAGVCAILLAGIAALTINVSNDFIERRPSTFFTDPTGTRAILLVLQRVLPSIEQWRRPMTELPSQPGSPRFTLIVMGPAEALTEPEAAVLDRWLASGGQLIIAAGKEWQIRKPNQSRETRKKEDDFLPRGYLARHGLAVIPDVSGTKAIDAATTKKVGSGRIVFVPDSYAFSNQTLRTTDDAVWLAMRSSEWSQTTFIDEYHHGFGQKRGLSTLIRMFLTSVWGLVSLQLALAGVVFLLGYKRRFGRPIEQLTSERTSPIEAVEALGGLFETARARALSVRSIHQYLNMYLSSLFGRPIDLANAAVRKAIAQRSSMTQPELDSYAEAVKRALDSQESSDTELIRIARTATIISRSFSHGSARKRPAAAG